MILLSLTKAEVSKKGMDGHGGQLQLFSFSFFVWLIVNLIVGWILFKSSRNLCKFSTVPVQMMKISSKNRFHILIGWIPSPDMEAKSWANLSIFAINKLA